MATLTENPEREEIVDGDRIEKGTPLTRTTTNISISPELFEKVRFPEWLPVSPYLFLQLSAPHHVNF